jgi:hypothetical protein
MMTFDDFVKDIPTGTPPSTVASMRHTWIAGRACLMRDLLGGFQANQTLQPVLGELVRILAEVHRG